MTRALSMITAALVPVVRYSRSAKAAQPLMNALKIVENLEHRAGKDAEGKTGDGVGILTQITHTFFQRGTAAELGIDLSAEIGNTA